MCVLITPCAKINVIFEEDRNDPSSGTVWNFSESSFPIVRMSNALEYLQLYDEIHTYLINNVEIRSIMYSSTVYFILNEFE